MRHHSLTLMIAVVASLAVVGNARGQSASPSEPPLARVVITTLHEPVYPPIAHTAHITGDVALRLQIRQDGTVQSVEFVSGPPLLKQSAMDSARESQFECRGCTEALTSYSVIYSFELQNQHTCTPSSGPPQVSISQSHVWITAFTNDICDLIAIKVRSMKCLYLWRCATR
jgi:Gram-negative bacterial TonB protein C-terminal